MFFTNFQVLVVNLTILGQLDNCSNMEHFFSVNNLILNDANTHKFRLNFVCQNTRITDQSNNWNVLLFKEAYHIKEKCSVLNNGIKRLEKCNSFERLLTIMYIQIMF